MKVIGFLGYSEKVDLITSISKTIQVMGKNVLVVDATAEKKYKYVVPSLDMVGKAYVTQYDSVDYAVGFDSMNEIENYMVEQKINISLYDYLLIDIDNSRTYEYFRTRLFNKMYLVMNTSILALKKDAEILNSIKVYSTDENNVSISKVMYRGYLTRASERYFQDKLQALNYNWDEKEYEIFESDQDKMLYLDFQISGSVQLRKHSKNFITSVVDIVAEILEDNNISGIKKAIKKGGI